MPSTHPRRPARRWMLCASDDEVAAIMLVVKGWKRDDGLDDMGIGVGGSDGLWSQSRR